MQISVCHLTKPQQYITTGIQLTPTASKIRNITSIYDQYYTLKESFSITLNSIAILNIELTNAYSCRNTPEKHKMEQKNWLPVETGFKLELGRYWYSVSFLYS